MSSSFEEPLPPTTRGEPQHTLFLSTVLEINEHQGKGRKEGHTSTTWSYQVNSLEIFQRSDLLGYFDKLRGYDDEITLEFALNFHNIKVQEYVTAIKGLEIFVDEDSISRVSIFTMGLPWDKEEI